jgi:proteic killer suppression protein
VEISFQSQRLAGRFGSERELRREYGTRIARTILTRIGVLAGANTLEMIPNSPPERLHQLAGQRQHQFAVDLVHPFRLVFEPDHDPVSRNSDGGIDLTKVTAIVILGVIDYH